MSDKAIVTISMGDYSKIAVLTHPSIQRYAERIGADFVVIDKRTISQTSPHWEKFQIYHMLNQYRRILYIDTDAMVREDCPDLFSLVPEDKLGVFNEGSFTERRGAMHMAAEQYGIRLDDWNGTYYNTGVMVIGRQHKQLFKKPENEISNFNEQSYLNLVIHKTRTAIHKLDYKFNRMTCLDQFTGEHRLASYIVHYAGCPNIDMLLGIMRTDVERWARKEFEHKRNVLIKVHGGIGDEISAEPVIRHIATKVYPGQNINVMTWFPRIYKHLPIKVFKMGKFETMADTPYFLMNTLVPETHVAWMFMTISLMQPIDYISLLLLKKILPDADRQVRLQVDDADLTELNSLVGADLDKLVVIHPGKGWPSKTFPVEWYDKIVDGLLAAGRKVAIIGKWVSEDQGTVPVRIREGVYDLQNLLTLGGMFALLSKARVLISNDSSPVHIAGAFDNHIILIPTCKHPDHVLPVRNGSRYHKAAALYKRLTCDEVDSSPTLMGDKSTIDYVNGDIYDYIPDPEAVINEAISRSQGG